MHHKYKSRHDSEITAQSVCLRVHLTLAVVQHLHKRQERLLSPPETKHYIIAYASMSVKVLTDSLTAKGSKLAAAEWPCKCGTVTSCHSLAVWYEFNPSGFQILQAANKLQQAGWDYTKMDHVARMCNSLVVV